MASDLVVLRASVDVEEPEEIKIVINEGPKFTSCRVMVSKEHKTVVLSILEEVNTMLHALTQVTRVEKNDA